ncbi:hypothetical protein [Bacillus atrophaeus]|uniref:hypothetical protein n=1 Tax=Bacillus atrophaeus TaxID=1452 RepID=UPI002E212327|nr:hypothetical protein [Bacillus atrophaeus]
MVGYGLSRQTPDSLRIGPLRDGFGLIFPETTAVSILIWRPWGLYEILNHR